MLIKTEFFLGEKVLKVIGDNKGSCSEKYNDRGS